MVVNDNLAKMMAEIVIPLVTGTFTKNVSGFIDVNGNDRTLTIWAPNTSFTFNSANVSLAQVGKGTTPATRQDRKIETPFTNGGIEDGVVGTQPSGYNSGLGKITVATQIAPTVGAGAISEIVKINNWKANTGLIHAYCLTRDLVSPVVNFIGGQTIDTEHIFLI